MLRFPIPRRADDREAGTCLIEKYSFAPARLVFDLIIRVQIFWKKQSICVFEARNSLLPFFYKSSKTTFHICGFPNEFCYEKIVCEFGGGFYNVDQ